MTRPNRLIILSAAAGGRSNRRQAVQWPAIPGQPEPLRSTTQLSNRPGFRVVDSTGPRGGLGCKFQRALVSEIVGYDAVVGKKTSSRIDPAEIMRSAATLYERKSESGNVPHWTLNEKDGVSWRKGGRFSSRNELVESLADEAGIATVRTLISRGQ